MYWPPGNELPLVMWRTRGQRNAVLAGIVGIILFAVMLVMDGTLGETFVKAHPAYEPFREGLLPYLIFGTLIVSSALVIIPAFLATYQTGRNAQRRQDENGEAEP